MRTIISFLALLLLTNFVQAETSYRIIDLNPPESIESHATNINDLGQVVGYYFKDKGKFPIVFLWDKESGFRDIGEGLRLPKINNLGHIISTKPNPNLWNLWATQGEPYIWTPEKGIQHLNTPQNGASAALTTNSINDHDQVLVTTDDYISQQRSWIWYEGRYKELKEPLSPVHLSNQQLLTGMTKQYDPMRFYIEKNNLSTFTLDTDYGTTLMSNAQENSIGNMKNPEGDKQSFSWNKEGSLKILPQGFDAVWMNDHDEILGIMKPSYGVKAAYLFDGTNLLNIGEAADIGSENSGFTALNNIHQINNHRQIVGSGFIPGKETHRIVHAFIIEPVED